jgi:hypothetical protein
VLYRKPVRLLHFGIRDIQFGKTITEDQLEEIMKAAGQTQEYRP